MLRFITIAAMFAVLCCCTVPSDVGAPFAPVSYDSQTELPWELFILQKDIVLDAAQLPAMNSGISGLGVVDFLVDRVTDAALNGLVDSVNRGRKAEADKAIEPLIGLDLNGYFVAEFSKAFFLESRKSQWVNLSAAQVKTDASQATQREHLTASVLRTLLGYRLSADRKRLVSTLVLAYFRTGGERAYYRRFIFVSDSLDVQERDGAIKRLASDDAGRIKRAIRESGAGLAAMAAHEFLAPAARVSDLRSVELHIPSPSDPNSKEVIWRGKLLDQTGERVMYLENNTDAIVSVVPISVK
jgi:hypothetical protein